jgi:glycosyltransferase involved in cell wall biosynthesis
MKHQEMLKRVKIGVCLTPFIPEAPAFRRRFGYYLKCRGLTWELADYHKPYDVVLVHHSGDLTKWQRYTKGKIIFDYNDDYLGRKMTGVRNIGRGLAKFLSGRWSKLVLDYRAAYRGIMRRAEAIVCATEAQRAQALALCSNVHKLFDMQADAHWQVKEEYASSTPFNLVWEGLPSFAGLQSLSGVIQNVQQRHPCALHLVTALTGYRYLENMGKFSTKEEVAKQLPFKNVWLYEWNSILFTKIVTACDLGIIPIDMNDPFWVSKPANKLLFFWRMGMPTLVSGTPEYRAMMNAAGIDMACEAEEEWLVKYDAYINDEGARRAAGQRGLAFVREHFSEEKQLAQWDQVLDSVL